MKTLIAILALTTFSASAFAVATCPKETTKVKICKSTPQPGDEVIATGLFSSIAICKSAGKTVGVFETPAGESESMDLEVIARTGATSYRADAGEVDVTIQTNVVRDTKNNSKFVVYFKDANLSATSTYTCK